MTTKKFKLVENKNMFREFNYAMFPEYRGLPRKFTISDIPNLNISAALKLRLNSLRPGTFIKIGKLSRETYVYVVVDDGQTIEQTLGPNILRREIKKLNREIAELKLKRQTYLNECVRRGINTSKL